MRSNKIGERKSGNKKTPEEILEIIFEDVIRAAAMPFNAWNEPASLVPLAIPVFSGAQYSLTQVGVDAAHELTRQTWEAREDFRQTISRARFNMLSFTAIGETILKSSTHLPNVGEGGESGFVDDAFYTALAADYIDNLRYLSDQARSDFYRHIPCNLFHGDQDVESFSIGPIEFQPRGEWIDRFVTNIAERDYLQRVQDGTLQIDELRRQALSHGSSREVSNSWRIVCWLQGFEWVATVKMDGHEIEQSHHKASTIVGLAIDAIGLRFQVEDARRFTKAGRRHLYSEERLATTMKGAMLHGMSLQMPGIGSAPGALSAKMKAERPFLEAAGRILEAYVRGRQTAHAPHLIERWANALYWVGEARREFSDFMAVVNYGCAADCLSGAGGNATAMTNFAQAALNPGGKLGSIGSSTIKDAITTVYREGRNKLAHGEMSGLLEDLSETRVVGDALLVHLFDVVTVELASIIVSRPQIFEIDEKLAYRALEERLQQRGRTAI